MHVLLMRFDAPLMSFGAPIVDNRGVIQPYPALSMITGLLANALGYDHSDFDKLERLQERVAYASRQDRRGERLRDFQTVDFGLDHLQDENAWTTRGTLEGRGSRLSGQTHIRQRDYWVDAIHTVAVGLHPPDEAPDLETLGKALETPARPLFIGRKTCLPATTIARGIIEAKSLRDALVRAPLDARADEKPSYRSWWPTSPKGSEDADISRLVTDRRDWKNQIHVGERWIAEGSVCPESREEPNYE